MRLHRVGVVITWLTIRGAVGSWEEEFLTRVRVKVKTHSFTERKSVRKGTSRVSEVLLLHLQKCKDVTHSRAMSRESFLLLLLGGAPRVKGYTSLNHISLLDVLLVYTTSRVAVYGDDCTSQ